MCKKSMFCSLLMMVVVTSPPAFADSTTFPYVGATIGTPLTSINKVSDSSASLPTDFNPGFMAGAVAGVTFDSWGDWNMERIRVEAEIGYRSSELIRMKNTQGQSANMSGMLSVTNFMVNGYVENTSMIADDLPVIMFLTAGAGAAIATIDSISYRGTTLVSSSSNTQLAYQGGFGVGYELTKNITLDATYKYLGTTEFKFAGIKADYGSHNVLCGVRYLFR